MIELVILIVLADNAGTTFTPSHHAAFEAFLVATFGGFTRLGTVTGGWADAGVVYTDESVQYLVALKSITDGAKVGDVVAFAKVHYRQEAIYVRYLGLAEIL